MKAILIIIDGWGVRAEKEWNAIAQARTPHYSRMLGTYPNTVLEASGLRVGLLDGVMGNSEVGHMNIGAGRRVVQDQVRIHEAIDRGEFFQNDVLKKEIERANKDGGSLHLLGLVSQGNVHSAERHYISLLELIHREGFPPNRLFVHAILDGRDTPPKSAEGYLRTLETKLTEMGGKIATVSGRFYAMDRDQRWERIDQAYKALVDGKGAEAKNALLALEQAYGRGETDEFVTPTVIAEVAGSPTAKIQDKDHVICFNFRPDRMRQIVRTISEKSHSVSIVTFTQYDKTFKFPVAFSPVPIDLCLGEVISNRGEKQFRTAETEKYAHVTYFLNCGREEPFPKEERLLIPSPKVKTYDLTPEMSSKEVTAAVLKRIQQDEDTLIVVNFAHPDMVGHTGNFDAAVIAVESTDRSLGQILEAGMGKGFDVMITADHGNVEMMRDPVTGSPHTAHTTNPVPFIVSGKETQKFKLRSNGALCDVAPTLFELLGISKPQQMKGESLLLKS